MARVAAPLAPVQTVDSDAKLAFVEFLLTSEGRVVRAQFYAAVIRSQRRFTYGEVLTILQRPPVDPIERMVHAAH